MNLCSIFGEKPFFDTIKVCNIEQDNRMDTD